MILCWTVSKRIPSSCGRRGGCPCEGGGRRRHQRCGGPAVDARRRTLIQSRGPLLRFKDLSSGPSRSRTVRRHAAVPPRPARNELPPSHLRSYRNLSATLLRPSIPRAQLLQILPFQRLLQNPPVRRRGPIQGHQWTAKRRHSLPNAVRAHAVPLITEQISQARRPPRDITSQLMLRLVRFLVRDASRRNRWRFRRLRCRQQLHQAGLSHVPQEFIANLPSTDCTSGSPTAPSSLDVVPSPAAAK